jgi:ABC-type transport system substrate-binding protein
VTAWLEEAIQVADFNKRKELYCKVIKTLHEEYPCIFIFRGEMAVGMRAKVKGYKPHINSMDRYAGGGLHYAWLE